MAEFGYVAFAADGSHNSVSDIVTADNKAEAEKKVRAKFSYQVNIRWDDEVLASLDSFRPFYINKGPDV